MPYLKLQESALGFLTKSRILFFQLQVLQLYKKIPCQKTYKASLTRTQRTVSLGYSRKSSFNMLVV